MKRAALALLPFVCSHAGTDKLCFDLAAAASLSNTVQPPPAVCGDAARENVPVPRINFRVRVASPTRSPWIVANGWRFLRRPGARYLYELPAGKAVLAMAEAFAYDAEAGFRLDPRDIEDAARMLAFLRSIPDRHLPPLADFAFVNDGSSLAAEAINLLCRRNLLAEIVRRPDPRYALNVVLGSADFPRELAANPGELAQAVRSKLTDERRSLRLYGTEMAIVRATGDGKSARLHILNYSDRPLTGVRLRVRGAYAIAELHVFGYPGTSVAEFSSENGFAEFSIPEMGAYAVADLR